MAFGFGFRGLRVSGFRGFGFWVLGARAVVAQNIRKWSHCKCRHCFKVAHTCIVSKGRRAGGERAREPKGEKGKERGRETGQRERERESSETERP